MKLLCPPSSRLVASDSWSPVILHVAVGKSRAKAVALIDWTFRQFGCKELVLVHVHQPSLTIPTLLGKLPVDGACEKIVKEHRNEEKREMEIILDGYVKFCSKAQAQAKIIMMEAGDVQRGIVELITKYGIQKLVMGATSDMYFNAKSKSKEAILSAPLSCEIYFVSKGKHIWTREASEGTDGTENGLREKAKACEAAIKQEVKAREQLQDILHTTRRQQEEIIKNNLEAVRELENVNVSLAILDFQAKSLARNCDVVARELDHMYSSIKYLNEMKETHRQEEKLKKFVNHARSPNNYKLFGDHSDSCFEFSAIDVKTATCDFSESFKLGGGGYKCMYKGEILDRTVVIKKLHQQNGQGQKEFQQEVNALSKLNHPHIMSLIGSCSELLSLVYEYLPNGTLCHWLPNKAAAPLDWKTRIRIIFEISTALLFLNSSKPERIIHGNLNLDSIFLDSNLNCKVGDFSKCRFVSEDAINHAFSYHEMEPQGDFWYMDPVYQRTRVLTTKSDVYSFGVIILQMITGKSAIGLVNEVQRSVSCDKLYMMLDTSAGEWSPGTVKKLVDIGLQCTVVNDQERLELTPELVRALKQLYLAEELHTPPFFLCPILQEIMHDPQVAADGFTYEGSAIKEWLLNGRSTSPMTNNELSLLDLVPNHALRFAIQDWLCQTYQS